MKDHYKTLGLLPDADDVVIKAAYKALAQKYHPDKNPEGLAENNKKMSELNEAYAVLGFKNKRKEYDLARDSASGKAKSTKAGKAGEKKAHEHKHNSHEYENEHDSGYDHDHAHTNARASGTEDWNEVVRRLRNNQMDEFQLINLFEEIFSMKVDITSGYINNYSIKKGGKVQVLNFEEIKLELINHLTK